MFKVYKTAIAVALTATAVGAATLEAQAARFSFGADETLHAYAKTGMTHENKPVDLCYKSTTFNVIAPVHTTDEMVLCDVEKGLYWPIPNGDSLTTLQNAGLMPNPMPSYERPMLDIIMGYFLWIILGTMATAHGIATLFARKSKKQLQTASQTAA